jgi:hydroxyethylthiazole kinase-like uncharacterized protein yjeF
MATHARAAGIAVRLIASGEPGAHASDAWFARDAFVAAGGEVLPAEALNGIATGEYACIVDGLLGIGIAQAPRGETARLIELVNRAAHPLTLALDIPSGLDADTGSAHWPCVQASHTLSFIAAKPGLFTMQGPQQCGEVRVATLDVAITASQASASADTGILALWPRRSLNSHKGSHGDVVALGGDAGMAGAAVLAGRAAVCLGAGRVFLGLLDGPHPPGYDSGQPELMLRHAEALADHGGIWCMGPGMGQSDRARTLLKQLLTHWLDIPKKAPDGLVLDADALNLLAADPSLAVKFKQLQMPKVITPHPLEAARLLGCKLHTVQADRLEAARSLTHLLDAVTVLKGMGSIINSATKQAINLSGGPALASGGTGDVLAGALAALLAQMLSQSHSQQIRLAEKNPHAAYDASRLAVFLHGACCDQLTGENAPPMLLTASELPHRMRAVLQENSHF